ncbi:hypothetical protein Lepto7376_2817 [[Leptolyngbya] sp. PCC 7376]|uniref:hypothetical protein n=1 Tax=[Leptolyngbya] sp. PCC 7376 TaxID=111781 RepID=UPI00029EF3BD|nr:hypothetical protein [[Leptolyngbya] sp. PCC 7376]AFY39074.1 hypothetical protein Lepto7376_2817 [[Leptolyngbya] sp. PCC 7376]
MQFTLYYRGDLKSNGKPAHKHKIRQYFHPQLKELWKQLPLRDFAFLYANTADSDKISLCEEVELFTFVPLVSDKISLIAELDIQILWPQKRGEIITNGGDIDNRLKTLFDALKVPSEPTALPLGTSPSKGEEPFFCLLKDDSLITRLSVETDHLLDPDYKNNSSEVILFIRVTTNQLRITWDTVGLA